MDADQINISELIDNIRIIIHKFSGYSKVTELATGLTGPQIWALQIIYITSPIMISNLAKHMNLTPATTVGLINRLEAKKLVVRSRSNIDRRAVHLYLTESGTNLISTIPDIARDMMMKELSQLTDNQFTAVNEGLRLIANLFKLQQRPLHSYEDQTTVTIDRDIYE